MLNIQTFDAQAGGNVIYKALAHPLAGEAIARLYAGMTAPVAIYDPGGIADALLAMYPLAVDKVFVHDVSLVGQRRAGRTAQALTELPCSGARTVLIAAFDAERAAARIRPMLPKGAEIVTLDAVRIPAAMLSVPGRYLEKLNFATNFVFFRDDDRMATRLVSANYWSNHGARTVRLWLLLFGADGETLASWEETLPEHGGGFAIDSREVRARFGLGPFTGQLMLHAIGVAGHDIVKYALDTFATDNGASLSCTHDANAWPSDRFAGLPAPRADETVTLWLQNSHAVPIPRGAIGLDRMGAERSVTLDQEIGPFATVAIDVGALLPGVSWPGQIELRAGRHVVRPRYEVTRAGRTRIAHVNVERDNLRPDPGIPALSPLLGRGYLLPFPILDRSRFRSIVQPTPMATTQANLPIRLDVFDSEGRCVRQRFLGCVPRDHSVALEVEDVAAGHAELVYDFRDGGEADGWLHALFRYEDRQSGHVAESSFGALIFNTAMTYRDEPQSYTGAPPGLTTTLFLKLGFAARHSFAVLIYPASAAWHPRSSTELRLHHSTGLQIATEIVHIDCSGSVMLWPHEVFGAAALTAAGANGYVLVRDATCRLFGYHGLMDDAGGFSLDHMFGF
ncbi:MAG TPA: hypothetical protein VHX39_10435 [Acetobacteraceae bacterium]|nr:hypothetical protein [Acetobacteraceae bacterium]